MKRRLSVLALASALALPGCSGGAKSYPSPNALVDAYVEAGATCDDPTEVPEAMLSEGAHGLFCAADGTMAMLIVFDSQELRDRYVARVDTGDYDGEIIGGERWVVAGEGIMDYADPLGGEPIVGQ